MLFLRRYGVPAVPLKQSMVTIVGEASPLCPSYALKGQLNIAQGDTLGKAAFLYSAPCKGS